MRHSSLPRYGVGPAISLACLLSASALWAQDAPTTPASPAPAVQTQAPVATPAVTPAPAPAETAAPATQPPAAPVAEPPATPASGAETPAAETPQAPAETVETPAVTPAPVPVETVAEPPPPSEGEGGLVQALQDALAPLAPTERDPNLPHDLSPMGMFWAADRVVKAVMIGLALASVATWTVLVVKLLQLTGASRRVGAGIRRIEKAPNLTAALSTTGRRGDPVSRMIRAAAKEYDRSAPALDQAGSSGLKERVDSHLERIAAVAGRRMGVGTGLLATIGSIAPFVGLFGTVWGIMNSFIGISEAQTTNLAVVAPGIAEALLATAIGLVAAIPAVVIYNIFARAITGYRLRLVNAAAGVKRLVSRDLDFRDATGVQAKV
ncbi:MAG: tonB-system energizer ExbB [Paracoccus sp. (in: a-proteobacteria)]|uniref:tonB-system energizer ExbB n=1 Tax=Paracoccus sp. TaxID=267 RepID=UPI0039E58718